MNRIFTSFVLFAATCLAASRAAAAVIIDTVPVGNPGNIADTAVMNDGTSGYGSVGYGYRIGTTDVTNAQYAAFLNAKAASDPLGLYSTSMGSAPGGITRSGSSPNFTYSTITGRANKPVNFVSWYDAVRFANWLNNGQGNGSTETGAYTLLGGTPTPSNGDSITRNPGATWFLPSENEWYKAAYYNPSSGTYFQYATASNTAPTAEAPPGGNNSANFNSVVNDLTDAGAYSGTKSPYGAFDMAGNLNQWNEILPSAGVRGARGASFHGVPGNLSSSGRFSNTPTFEGAAVGFRMATVPEPSTGVLALVGCALAVALRRARRA
jgi:formylglycine-generating enzyme